MKFFFWFFLVLTAICGYFWATDAPGSGMVYPTVFFAVIAVVVGIRNTVLFGSPFRDGRANSFALPLLFLLNFNLSGWWLLVLALGAVWAWALSRKSSGDYDFGPGMALCAALLITVACLVGVGFGWLMA